MDSLSMMRMGGMAALCALLLATTSASMTVDELIDRAGNARDDEQCLMALRDLRELPGTSAELRADASRLIREVDRWMIDPRLDYFGDAVYKNGSYDFGFVESSPLYPVTRIYQARMLFWVTLEYGGIWSVPEKRRERLDLVRATFERAATRFPANPVLQMYLGAHVPPERAIAADPAAPDWANAQREALERLADIVQWWIDRRMQPDCQYGGGWGDDCEMWRWWAPILVGFDDPKIVDAQARFSRALLSQPHMTSGYTDHVFDAEHTSEDSADTLTPMMLLRPYDPEWQERAMRIAALMRDRWTGTNDRGHVQFKSSYYSSKDIDLAPKRAVDNFYNVRAVQPALLLWQRTKDPELGRVFTAWMDTWVDASMRAERGKPAGIVPSAIHWPDGNVGGVGAHWWDPENHPNDTLYVWPNAMPLMLHALLLAQYMTGDAKYVAPIRAMADLRAQRKDELPDTGADGGPAWCSSRLATIDSALGKYWMVTGDTSYGPLLAEQGPAYLRFRVSGKRDALERALDETAAALRINFPGYTREVRYTDRVLRFPSVFGANGIYPEGRPGIETPDTDLLYSCVTGDPANPQVFPLNAVRWLTPPREIAVLVTQSRPDRFEAELFHFGDALRPVSALLPLLEPGTYAFTATATEKDGAVTELARKQITVTDSNNQVSFDALPHRLCTVRVMKD